MTRGRATLANGSEDFFDIHNAVVIWDGQPRPVLTDVADTAPLAGMSLLNGQLLAYATALDPPGGLLIYAKGEADTWSYRVKNTSKCLEVMALNLSGTLDEVLERVNHVAERVQALRKDTKRARLAA